MVSCPVCDAVIEVEEDELDEGDQLSCDECGATLNVLSLDPLEVEKASDEDEDEDDEDEDEDDEDVEDEEDEEDEDADEDWR